MIDVISNFIELVSSFAPMWDYCLTFVLAFAFVVTVPCLIREVIRFV